MLLYTRSKLDSDILIVLGEFRGITMDDVLSKHILEQKP